MAAARRTGSFLVLILVLAFVFPAECGRKSGGGGSRKSSGSSIFKSNPAPAQPKNPQNSYPKQTYGGGQLQQQGTGGNRQQQGTGGGFANPNQGGTNVGGGGFVNPNQGGGHQSNIGGGGFVNPNQGNRGGAQNNFGGSNYGAGQNNYGAGGFSSNQRGTNYGNVGGYGGNHYGGSNFGGYNYGGRNNFGGGYYSGGSFKQSNSMFGTGGKKAFGLGAGAGFLGGAVAAVGAMSVYHRFRQYQYMMDYQRGGYGYGGGYGYSPYGRNILVNAHDCVGGCPMQAFCDYGICRCREGYEARFGQCHQSFGDLYNSKREEFDRRTSPSFNPYKPCATHSECRVIDMNMICAVNGSSCACRSDMKWNSEVGECQIFMNVDCSDVSPKTMALDTATTSSATTTTSTTTVKPSDESSVNGTSFGEVNNSTFLDEEEDDGLPENITSITFSDTLKDSKLTKLDINNTSEAEIKTEFCKEIGAIAEKYQQQNVRRQNQIVSSNGDYYNTVNRKKVEDAALGAGAIALIVILVCCCCGCVCLCVCIKKVKEVLGGAFGGSSSRKSDYETPEEENNMNMGQMDNGMNQPQPPPPVNYPPTQYPPQPMYPPVAPEGYGGGAVPYPTPGGPSPYGQPYPPEAGTPYPTYGGQQPGYNPAYPPPYPPTNA